MKSATGVPRSIAVFIDLFAYSIIWGVIGALAHESSTYVGLAVVFSSMWS